MKRYKQIWKFISLAISVAAAVYLVYRLLVYEQYGEVMASFRTASTVQVLALCMAVMLMPMQLWIEAKRWQTLLHPVLTLRPSDAWEQVLTGLLAGFITPYRLGEYPARLAQAGYVFDEQTLRSLTDWHHWRQWLTDWRKWGKVLAWTVARYCVWGTQLWAVLYFCGIYLDPLEALIAIGTYYICVTIFPSVPAVEVATKGGWALFIFQAYTSDTPRIVVAVTVIWLVNTILPLLFVYLRKYYYFCRNRNKEE